MCDNEHCVSGSTCLHEYSGKQLCCGCANAYEMGQSQIKVSLRNALNGLDRIGMSLALGAPYDPEAAVAVGNMRRANDEIRKKYRL